MPSIDSKWASWARFLQQRRLDGVTTSVIESVGPLAIIGAQILYLGQPFFNDPNSANDLNDLAHLIENPDERKNFAAFLREARPK
jgi:hypothetical protein